MSVDAAQNRETETEIRLRGDADDDGGGGQALEDEWNPEFDDTGDDNRLKEMASPDLEDNTVPSNQPSGQSSPKEPTRAKGFHKKHSGPVKQSSFSVKIASVVLSLTLITVALRAMTMSHKDSQKTPARSFLATYDSAAVVSSYDTCSMIGTDVLKENGNAFDAMIATSLCLGVLEMSRGGIGGGGFAVVYEKKSQSWFAIDGRDAAPLNATRDMFVDDKRRMSLLGGLAIAVPGTLAMYIEMHNRFGTLPWKRLIMPTVKLLRNGYPLTEQTHSELKTLEAHIRTKSFIMFINTTDFEYKDPGSIIKDSKLAKTFERIAEDKNAFYDGSLAEDIAADIQEAGGIITVQDLKQYKAKVKTPIKLTLPGRMTLYTSPLPSSGVVLAHILAILSGYQVSARNIMDEDSEILTYHRIVEAMKFAFAARSSLGDEDFVLVHEIIRNLTSLEFSENVRKLIDDEKTYDPPHYTPGYYNQFDSGTSKAVVIDEMGNAVSLMNTINLKFGSQVRGSRTGIIFNNQMDDFSTPGTVNSFGFLPSPSNFIVPGKRPMSSVTPLLVWDNTNSRVCLAVAASGGPKIITLNALMVIRMLWLGESVTTSLDRPRFHNQLFPNQIKVEDDFPKVIERALIEKGHTFSTVQKVQASALVLRRLSGPIEAGVDFREAGAADGY